MSRPRKSIPSYLLHPQSGRARAVWTDTAGCRHFQMLPGIFDSSESRSAFARLQLELETAPLTTASGPNPTGLTLAMLLLAFDDYAEREYRTPNGTRSDEVRHFRSVSRTVREMYGHTLATEFGPLALKAVRQQFIARGWCRKTVNRQVDRVRQIFKWAVAEQLVLPTVHQALVAVAGLRQGRSAARETDPVRPVPDEIVDATLPHLNRHVRSLVEFQRLTGCRPGEAMSIRRSNIDASGPTWVYRPPHHKNSHRGKGRTIYIGPEAQATLKEFFTPNIDDYLFSPIRAAEEVRVARAAKRKTPCYPSCAKRDAAKRKANPKRQPAARYTRMSYLTAVTRACDRAFPPLGGLAKQKGESVAKWKARLTPAQRDEVKTWQREHRWFPYQLRHTFGTQIRKEHGLEAAQVMLGHSRADVTQVYAERNEKLATSIAAKIG